MGKTVVLLFFWRGRSKWAVCFEFCSCKDWLDSLFWQHTHTWNTSTGTRSMMFCVFKVCEEISSLTIVPWNHIIFLSCIIFTKLCKIMHIIQCQGILHDAICTCDFFFRDAVPFGKRMPALNILVGSQGQLSRWDILKIKNSFYFLSHVTSFEEPYANTGLLEKSWHIFTIVGVSSF